jgi:hypothetical protein
MATKDDSVKSSLIHMTNTEFAQKWRLPTAKYGLVYVVLMYISDKWMIKVGKRDSIKNGGLEERFLTHRRTYGLEDGKEFQTFIPLKVIKCGNSSCLEDKIKGQMVVHRVKNFSKPNSMHTEQSYNLTETYNMICKVCKENDLVEGKDFWVSSNCNIKSNDQIQLHGKIISNAISDSNKYENGISNIFSTILTQDVTDKINETIKKYTGSSSSFHVGPRRDLFEILLKLYELDTDCTVHSEAQKIIMRELIKTHNTGNVRVGVRKQLFDSVNSYMCCQSLSGSWNTM